MRFVSILKHFSIFILGLLLVLTLDFENSAKAEYPPVFPYCGTYRIVGSLHCPAKKNLCEAVLFRYGLGEIRRPLSPSILAQAKALGQPEHLIWTIEVSSERGPSSLQVTQVAPKGQSSNDFTSARLLEKHPCREVRKQ